MFSKNLMSSYIPKRGIQKKKKKAAIMIIITVRKRTCESP